MPGRFLTASKPSRTVILEASYVFALAIQIKPVLSQINAIIIRKTIFVKQNRTFVLALKDVHSAPFAKSSIEKDGKDKILPIFWG